MKKIDIREIIADDFFRAKAGEKKLDYPMHEVEDIVSDKIGDKDRKAYISKIAEAEALGVKYALINILLKGLDVIDSEVIKEKLKKLGINSTSPEYLKNKIKSLEIELSKRSEEIDSYYNQNTDKKTEDVYEYYISYCISISNWAKRDINPKAMNLLEWCIIAKQFNQHIEIMTKKSK